MVRAKIKAVFRTMSMPPVLNNFQPHFRPYNNIHDSSFYETRVRVKLLCLDTYTVHYVTQKGGYTGFHFSDRKVWTVEELIHAGFVEIEWDGRGTFAVLDCEDVIVMAMVGKPLNLTDDESHEWDNQAARYAVKVEQLRRKDERPFTGKSGHHSRGDFATVTFGVGYGGGRTKPTNTASVTNAERAIVNELLDDDDLQEFSARGSDALEFFFPLAHEVLCERMRALHVYHPNLRFPFKNSVYPACTMNCGPQSVSFMHSDGPDYPGVPGAIHAFGNFDSKLGGHLVPFELKIFIQFPPGTLSLLSSSGFRHGNTPIRQFETRYSFTQYVSGHLIKWITYGCRPAGRVPEDEKQALDEAMFEGWDNQRARLSNFFQLNKHRLESYMRRYCGTP